jgi:hypothetical protein
MLHSPFRAGLLATFIAASLTSSACVRDSGPAPVSAGEPHRSVTVEEHGGSSRQLLRYRQGSGRPFFMREEISVGYSVVRGGQPVASETRTRRTVIRVEPMAPKTAETLRYGIRLEQGEVAVNGELKRDLPMPVGRVLELVIGKDGSWREHHLDAPADVSELWTEMLAGAAIYFPLPAEPMGDGGRWQQHGEAHNVSLTTSDAYRTKFVAHNVGPDGFDLESSEAYDLKSPASSTDFTKQGWEFVGGRGGVRSKARVVFDHWIDSYLSEGTFEERWRDPHAPSVPITATRTVTTKVGLQSGS